MCCGDACVLTTQRRKQHHLARGRVCVCVCRVYARVCIIIVIMMLNEEIHVCVCSFALREGCTLTKKVTVSVCLRRRG